MNTQKKPLTTSLIAILWLTVIFSGMVWGENLNSSSLHLGKKRILAHSPGKTSGPAIQLDEQSNLHMAWTQETHGQLHINYLQSKLSEIELSNPIHINPSHQLAASLHEPPALALGLQKEVYVLWPTPHPQAAGKPFASVLQLSRSTDGGQTFLPPVRVNDDAEVTGHSFDHLTTDPDGTIHITWIDGREGKKDPATYSARSMDQGSTITKNIKIDDSTCVCCRTSVATSPDGIVYVAWRKIFSGNIRETVVARSKDGGQTFDPAVIVGHDQWVFAGCPHRPASLGVDGQGRVYVSWYTEGADETPGVYFSTSDDQGATFTAKTMLNSSKGTFPDHPQMAVDAKGRILVIWEEQSPVRREVVMRYSLDRGQTFSAPQKLNIKKSHHPAVAINQQGQALLAWQEQIAFPKWSTVLQPVSFEEHAPHLTTAGTP